jgi:hypothetical protein
LELLGDGLSLGVLTISVRSFPHKVFQAGIVLEERETKCSTQGEGGTLGGATLFYTKGVNLQGADARKMWRLYKIFVCEKFA